MFKIDNRYSNANVPRTIRFTEPLFEELNHVAEEHNVSFNMLVLQCCHYALDQLGQDRQEHSGQTGSQKA